MRLRQASEKDKETILEIIFSSLRHSVEPSYSSRFVRKMQKVYAKRVERYLEEGTLFVIEAGGKAVGTVGLVANEVKTLFISPLYQGLGYGKKALSLIEGLAVHIGHKVLRLDALMNAVGFYLNLGFMPKQKVVKRADYDPSLKYPVMRMRKNLR